MKPLPRRPLPRWLLALPPLLLALVACLQIALVQLAGLSPWLGGGFGMFASVDAWGRRHLHAFALRPSLRREIVPDRSAAPALRRALALPSDANLRALALALAGQPSPDEGPLEAIELEVWARRFDPATLAPSDAPIRALRVRVGTP